VYISIIMGLRTYYWGPYCWRMFEYMARRANAHPEARNLHVSYFWDFLADILPCEHCRRCVSLYMNRLSSSDPFDHVGFLKSLHTNVNLKLFKQDIEAYGETGNIESVYRKWYAYEKKKDDEYSICRDICNALYFIVYDLRQRGYLTPMSRNRNSISKFIGLLVLVCDDIYKEAFQELKELDFTDDRSLHFYQSRLYREFHLPRPVSLETQMTICLNSDVGQCR
jgi:hypothetical protein